MRCKAGMLGASRRTSASFVQSFSVASQDTFPAAIAFRPDGSQMFIAGSIGDDVNEYALSTAWDISTASYVQSFSVTSQESEPNGLAFKPDGTRMYVSGSSGDNVNEYALSTAWDISTASYVQSFSVAPNVGAIPNGLSFGPDGAAMFIPSQSENAVFEYALSTAWDISTASYVQSFSVAGRQLFVRDASFTEDGLLLYVVASSNANVSEYALSIPWDISTASYRHRLDVSFKDGNPLGVAVKPDGTRMYVLGVSSDSVHEFSLS